MISQIAILIHNMFLLILNIVIGDKMLFKRIISIITKLLKLKY